MSFFLFVEHITDFFFQILICSSKFQQRTPNYVPSVLDDHNV